MPTIRFYETNKAFGCFSNFSRHPIDLDGQTWATTEHFFQAAKFSVRSDIDDVRGAATAFQAAQIGRERGRSLKPDWSTVRDQVMLRALRAKFTQHADLGCILASTHGASLVEHTANDSYWGDGGDGSGRNRLGQLLEQVRGELRPTGPAFAAPPWVQHPGIDPSDMFWRMGRGEDCLSDAQRFWLSMPPEAQREYDAYFPVPAEWRHSWV